MATTLLIEDIWVWYREVFDACFPDVQVLSITEVSTGRFLLTADRHGFYLDTPQWIMLNRGKELVLRKIRYIHQILDSLEE